MTQYEYDIISDKMKELRQNMIEKFDELNESIIEMTGKTVTRPIHDTKKGRDMDDFVERSEKDFLRENQ